MGGHIGDDLGGHFSRRQFEVHHAGGDDAARHAIVLGGFGFLGQHQAALTLDFARPQRAVAAGAGEHDANGPLVLVLCQGTEEKINRQALGASSDRFDELKPAI